jgi:hypothetical protein
MSTPENAGFFAYQQRQLGILKAWGLGSVVVGLVSLLSPAPRVRHAGLQALSWGAIDAALALIGQRSARRKAQRAQHGDLDRIAITREVRIFRRILLINSALDMGYVLGGLWLLRTADERQSRQGMGLGIIVQGLFLLIYDALLARDVGRRWQWREP